MSCKNKDLGEHNYLVGVPLNEKEERVKQTWVLKAARSRGHDANKRGRQKHNEPILR